jgi:hypothetical protein
MGLKVEGFQAGRSRTTRGAFLVWMIYVHSGSFRLCGAEQTKGKERRLDLESRDLRGVRIPINGRRTANINFLTQ